MEVLTSLAIHRPYEVSMGSDREKRNPPSTPHLAPEWLSALVSTPRPHRSSTAQLFRKKKKKHSKLGCPLSPGGKYSLGNTCGHVRSLGHDLGEAKAEDTSEHQPAPYSCTSQRGRHTRQNSAVGSAHPALSCWQQRGKGNYRRAGLETLLWPHLNFRCPRECFQPPGIEAVSRYRCNMCLSCFCLHLNASTRWKPEGVEHCKQFWL